MRNVAWALVAVASLAAGLMACATGAPDDVADAGDGGGGGGDGSPGSDANGSCPTGRAGPKCDQCAGGFHKCGTSDCRPDQPNSPDAGCTQSCGAACSPPAHASGKCTSNGSCDFTCDTTFVPSGGGDGGAGCECPAGQIICGNVCAQCCSAADCPSHQLCNSGVCGGCEANWGDCNNNPGDGCEANLSAEPNCGSCGTSCCSYPCCGAFTFHGKSCKSSGNSFACGC